jgi:hypothetical protein
MDYSTSAYNWDPNVDIVKRPLWPYTAHDPSIFRCPSDSSFVVVNRVMKPRVRSFSMNLFVGGFPAPVSFPSVSSYRVFSKTTDFTVMPPTKAFVFLDERPDVIIWGNFLVNMTGYPKNPAQYELYQDLPGFFHNFGSSFSFADGRAEIHRWTDPRTVPPLRSTGASTIDTIAVPRDADVAWLQDHATRPK